MYVYLVIGVTFLADRISKGWATTFLAEHGTTRLNRLLTLREAYNRGLAFGFLQGVGQLTGWFSLIILLLLFLYLQQLPRAAWLMRVGFALIIGGALGNLVDRIIAGQVLDFLDTPFRLGVFNVADVAINLGLLMCLASIFFQGRLQ